MALAVASRFRLPAALDIPFIELKHRYNWAAVIKKYEEKEIAKMRAGK